MMNFKIEERKNTAQNLYKSDLQTNVVSEKKLIVFVTIHTNKGVQYKSSS